MKIKYIALVAVASLGIIYLLSFKSSKIEEDSTPFVPKKEVTSTVKSTLKSKPIDIVPKSLEKKETASTKKVEESDVVKDQLKKDFPYVKEHFEPERRVVDHPEYGLIVELHYPKNVIRYELPGADDQEPTHEHTNGEG